VFFFSSLLFVITRLIQYFSLAILSCTDYFVSKFTVVYNCIFKNLSFFYNHVVNNKPSSYHQFSDKVFLMYIIGLITTIYLFYNDIDAIFLYLSLFNLKNIDIFAPVLLNLMFALWIRYKLYRVKLFFQKHKKDMQKVYNFIYEHVKSFTDECYLLFDKTANKTISFIAKTNKKLQKLIKRLNKYYLYVCNEFVVFLSKTKNYLLSPVLSLSILLFCFFIFYKNIVSSFNIHFFENIYSYIIIVSVFYFFTNT